MVGTISIKDLMGIAIEEQLTNPPRKLSWSVVLALRKNYRNRKSRKPWPKTEEDMDTSCDPVQHCSGDLENNQNNQKVGEDGLILYMIAVG